jgi:GNAT superfamily N-acetyltransferase
MRPLSLGWQTDLRLRRLEGAEIVEHDDHMIIRTPLNRSYRWGNVTRRHAAPRAGDGAVDRAVQAGLPRRGLSRDRRRQPLRRVGGDRRAARSRRAGRDAGYSGFIERQMRAIRNVCEARHGAWFGAFRDDRLQRGLGIFSAGAGTARFQSVETHPAHRRQGLASNLLIAAGHYANTTLKAGARRQRRGERSDASSEADDDVYL